MTEIKRKKLNIEKEYLLGRKVKAEKLPPEVFHEWKDEYQRICARLEEIEAQLAGPAEQRGERFVAVCREVTKQSGGGKNFDNYMDAVPKARQRFNDAVQAVYELFNQGSDKEFDEELWRFQQVCGQLLTEANTPVQMASPIAQYGEEVSGDGCPWHSHNERRQTTA